VKSDAQRDSSGLAREAAAVVIAEA
jgi:hypothetical protein